MYWVSLQATSSSLDESEESKPFTNNAINSTNTVSENYHVAGKLGNDTQNPVLNAYSVAPSQKVVSPQVPNTADQLIEVGLALALVIGLIYAAAWLVKRNKSFSPSAGIPMKTLSVLPMGVKEKIILVEVGGKQLLLGMTPHQINTLATFDEPIVDTTLTNEKPFAIRLKEMLNQSKGMQSETLEPKE
jgi:flagellar protein FliO/FliZ